MSTKAIDYKNDTFRGNEMFGYNACVGKNGYNEMDAYECGYDFAIKRLLRSATRDFDERLIYPIVFLARHRTELFLKNNIEIVSECKFIKENFLKLQKKDTSYNRLVLLNKLKESYYNNPQSKSIETTHSLEKLLSKLERLCDTDKRFEKYFNPVKPFIADYFDVDATGQAFRYPYDTKHRHHLDDTLYHINLLTFKKNYLQMTKKMERMNFIFLLILNEYELGTFTSFCSRAEIEAISKELPIYSEWQNASFAKLKTKLKKKYGLSSNQLSKIINIIKEHKEFSVMIDCLNPVKEINTKDVLFLLQCYKEFNSISEDKNYNVLKCKLVYKACANLEKDAIRAWIAFKELGTFGDCYSEEYEQLISVYKSKHDSKDDYNYFVQDRLFKSGKDLDYIKLGMRKCGQIHLLEIMP